MTQVDSIESGSEQAAVIAFLSNPRNYPNADAVKRIETHAAIVFLAGDRAYKLKRAVKLPYLDFSTLEKRRAVIERELEINSRESPELYLSVVPVTLSPDENHLELGSFGKAVDWLLVMRRFDQGALLHKLACEGRLTRELVVDLANTVEHFHRHAPVSEKTGFARSLEHVAADIESALCGPVAQAKGLRVCSFIERLRLELSSKFALIEEREREGFVRRCHGDLHLKNIVYWEGRPRLFDAIEFDDRLATIDVFYDLAFLLMDLWHRGLKREANVILNHYLQCASIREIEGLALLPLFLSLRSGIRAMTGIHALGVCAQAECESLVPEIESYAAFAASVLTTAQPQLVAIGGLSGVGKSSVAREFAAAVGSPPGAFHLRTDVERKIMHGVALTHRLPPEAYTSESRDEVYRRVFRKAEVALDSGCSVIVDAVFPEAAQRIQLQELAFRTNASFMGLWLDANEGLLRERVGKRSDDASDADAAIIEKQLKTIEPPEDWITIDASGGKDTTVAAIANALQGLVYRS
ncbi:MAG: AAA family ATPase [Rhodomicrobium sp.]